MKLTRAKNLIKHLLEYKKYKSVIDTFHKMEEVELMKEKRGNLMKELRALAERRMLRQNLQDVTIFKLMTVFEKILKRHEAEKNKPVHQVIQYPYTVEDQKKYIVDELSSRETDVIHRNTRVVSYADRADLQLPGYPGNARIANADHSDW